MLHLCIMGEPVPFSVRARVGHVAVVHSPLLYGLEIKEVFKVLRSYAFESKDYEV